MNFDLRSLRAFTMFLALAASIISYFSEFSFELKMFGAGTSSISRSVRSLLIWVGSYSEDMFLILCFFLILIWGACGGFWPFFYKRSLTIAQELVSRSELINDWSSAVWAVLMYLRSIGLAFCRRKYWLILSFLILFSSYYCFFLDSYKPPWASMALLFTEELIRKLYGLLNESSDSIRVVSFYEYLLLSNRGVFAWSDST